MDLNSSPETPRAVVIEDDPEIRALHKQVLEPLGFEVILTSNASDGVAAIREFDPEITFLDVNMDGMDGFTAASRVRAFSSTYIVMITALDSEIDAVQGLNAGADDYVVKPFRPRELRARVEAMLRRPRSRMPVVAPAVQPAPEPDLGLWRPTIEAVVTEPLVASAPATVAVPQPMQPMQPSAPRHAFSGAPDGSLEESTVVTGEIAVTNPGVPAVSTAPQQPAVRALDSSAALTSSAPGASTPDLTYSDGWRSHRDLHLHVPSGTAQVFDQQVQLAPAEVSLLVALMDSGARVRSTANLVLSLRGESYVTTYFVNEGDKRAVLDHMESLRRKLGDTGTSPIWIEPVKGVGFRMTAS